MLVRDIMTPNPFTIRLDKKVIAVEEIMSWAKVRHVPVVDLDGTVVGVVSQRDLLRVAISELDAQLSVADKRLALASVPIRKVLTPGATTISPDATVQEAAAVMHSEKIGCLPVTRGGKLVGIVTDHDLLGVLSSIHVP